MEGYMHHSVVGGFIIDCKTDDLDREARFCVIPLSPGHDVGRLNTWHDE
jgi:hypothetical protein